jgi:glycosyltransferase involved in cell wall biosynthesis
MEPFISVIMPVYNQEKYLEETIKSVLNQSFTNFEFNIIDDGSTDNSAAIIQRYAEKDKRIKARFDENAGRSTAANKLALTSSGKFLAFIDADDIMLPYRLEKQVAFHSANPQVTASSCQCHYIDSKGNQLGIQNFTGLKNIEDATKALQENQIVHAAITGLMVKKEAYIHTGGLRKEFWYSDDLDFFNRFIELGYTLVILQQPLMKYRIHTSSATLTKPLSQLAKSDWTIHCTLLRRAGKPEISFEEFLELRKVEPLWKKIQRKRAGYSNIFFRKAGIAMMTKDYLNFCKHITAAIALSPCYVLRKLTNLNKTKPI